MVLTTALIGLIGTSVSLKYGKVGIYHPLGSYLGSPGLRDGLTSVNSGRRGGPQVPLHTPLLQRFLRPFVQTRNNTPSRHISRGVPDGPPL